MSHSGQFSPRSPLSSFGSFVSNTFLGPHKKKRGSYGVSVTLKVTLPRPVSSSMALEDLTVAC